MRIDVKDQLINVLVEDEGNGFTVEEFNEIAQPFRTGGTNPGNSGLGLSIARDIARAHKGDIRTVRTNTGKTVFIQLPLDMRMSNTPDAPATPADDR